MTGKEVNLPQLSSGRTARDPTPEGRRNLLIKAMKTKPLTVLKKSVAHDFVS